MTFVEQLYFFAWRDYPIYRQPYYQHVRDWQRFMHKQFWLLYDADAQFRKALDVLTYKKEAAPRIKWRGHYNAA